MPQRIELIKHWLTKQLHADIHDFKVASNDASFRRYFRVSFNNKVAEQIAGQTFIIMDAPPQKEAITPFVNIALSLETTGVHVPHIHAVNQELGFILLSDLGQKDYLTLLNSDLDRERIDKLYADAMSALVVMQLGLRTDTEQKKMALLPYDTECLQMEMQLLPDWYAKIHCQQALNEAEQVIWQQAMSRLVESAQEQPQVFVHRDYHSRNLMYYEAHNPGVIDFQDAVIGPITYDVVSLLRDSYISWPDDRVYDWLEQYRQMLLRENLLTEDNKEQFVRWFDWMGIQRQLKVVGIFCRLNYRDGKANYLNDIPQTLAYLFNVCARYPEFSELLDLLLRLDKTTKAIN